MKLLLAVLIRIIYEVLNPHGQIFESMNCQSSYLFYFVHNGKLIIGRSRF